MEVLKKIFDNRATWATIGTIAGALFGDKALAVVDAVGALVMVAI